MASTHIHLGRAPLDDICLFVDLDGVLADFRARPSQVEPDAARTSLLLDACESLSGRVAVISGRPIREIDYILEGSCLSVAGLHGLERRTACGEHHTQEAHPAIANAGDVFEAFAAAHSGLFVEAKGQCVALHFRGAPEAQAAVFELAQRLADATGLHFQPGSMVAELQTPGAHKGTAVVSFLREAPFRGMTPVYIGDDLTDEDAFRAVAAREGLGVLVGPPRRSAARARLRSPDHVQAWLRSGLEAGALDLRSLEWLD